MKPGAPWSIKGIEQEARELAKERAKAEGLTLGQWLNKAISESGQTAPQAAPAASQAGGALDTARIMRAIAELARRVDALPAESGQAAADLKPLTDAIAAMEVRLDAISEALPTETPAFDQSRLERGLIAIARRIETLEQRPDPGPALAELNRQIANTPAGGESPDLSRIEASLASLESTFGSSPVSGDGDTAALTALTGDIRKVMTGMVNLAAKIDAANQEVGKKLAALDTALQEVRTESATPAPADGTERIEARVDALTAALARLSDQLTARPGPVAPPVPEPELAPAPLEPEPTPEPEPQRTESSHLAALNDLSAQDETVGGAYPDDEPFFREIEPQAPEPEIEEKPDFGATGMQDHEHADEIVGAGGGDTLLDDMPPPDTGDDEPAAYQLGATPSTDADPADRPRRLVAVESLLGESPEPEAVPDAEGAPRNTGETRKPFRLDEPLDLSRQRPETPRRRGKGWIGYAIAALVLAALLVGGFWFAGTPEFRDAREQLTRIWDGLAASAGLSGNNDDAPPPTAGTATGQSGGSAEPPKPAAPETAATSETAETPPPDPAPAPSAEATPEPAAPPAATVETAPEQQVAATPPPTAPQSDLDNLRDAAQAGSADAQYELGVRHRDGIGVEANYSTAADWFDRAAQQGHVPAQLGLGVMYRQGLRPDLDLARLWLHAAARAGNPDAQKYLAEVYVDESAGAPDYFQAARWFREAADQGVVDAQYNMGVLYAGGLGVPRDFEQSYYWFSLAMQSGDSGAAADVDRVSALLTPEQRQEQDARVSGFSPAPSAAGETGATTAYESPDRLTRRDEIKELQRLLIDRGYDPGVADGLPGSKTRDAIRAWQSDRGLPEVGQINRDVLTRLRADG